MYRTALRTASRPMLNGARCCTRAAPRRLASTASPADKPRSWKSSAARWGLAVGAVYYYSTSPVFADEVSPKTVPAPASFAESDLPTVDSVIEEKRRQISARLEPKEPKEKEPKEKQPEAAKATEQPANDAAQSAKVEGGPGQLQEEAGQQGAFNPETGEINWDCPCLGGMADGPCGEQFKTAFSCFVYSNEEPKGMDCIEKFQGMQECFREYPEIYGAELADEEAADAALDEPEPAGEYQKTRDEHSPVPEGTVATDGAESHQLPGAAPLKDPIPTKWDDATAANKEHVMNPHEKQEEQEKKEKKEKKE